MKKKSVNKNTVILIISALLILVSIVIAFFAVKDTDALKKSKTDNKPGVTDKVKSGDKSAKNNKNSKDSQSSDGEQSPTDETSPADKPYVFEAGKYKVATKEDPLGLRLEPNTDAQRLLYINKGTVVNVIAVWYDWGYVVYNRTGGWLSMNYLESVSGTAGTTSSAD